MRKGHGQPILVGVVDAIDQLQGGKDIGLLHHRDTFAHGQKPSDVKAIEHRIGRIPAFGLFCRRLQDHARPGPCLQDGLRCLVGVVPAGLVPIWPDEDVLARQRRPVRLGYRGIGTMHGRGGTHTQVDQGLRALLAFDHHNLLGLEHARLVVQRTRLGRGHLSATHIPGSELLAAGLGVVAVHDGNQFAACVLVVPLGRCGAELIHGWWLGLAFSDGAGWHGRNTTEPASGPFEHLRELGLHIEVVVTGDEVQDVSALVRGTVCPQARLGSRQ
jgi:hypothetical protein